MPVGEAIARAAAGELTTDAALVTLDFALRHRWIEPIPPRREPTGAGVSAWVSASQWRAFESLKTSVR
jgi:hypothetical protein